MGRGTLRPLTPTDLEFVLTILLRLVEFAPQSKDQEGLLASDIALTRANLEKLGALGTQGLGTGNRSDISRTSPSPEKPRAKASASC